MSPKERARLIKRLEVWAAAREADAPKLFKCHQPGHAAIVTAEARDLRAIAQELAVSASTVTLDNVTVEVANEMVA